jgi:hypothetical protein
MKKVFLASLLGGLTLFAWGAISWVALPWHNAVLHSMANEEQVVASLRQNLPSTGVYMFPGMHGEGDEAERLATQRIRRGPVGFIFYTAEGMNPFKPGIFVFGLLLFMFSSCIASTLLTLTLARRPSYTIRVFFVALLGVFVASEGHLNAWNWIHMQLPYAAVFAADAIVGWLLAGLVIAAIVKPPKEAQPAA